MLKMTNVKLQLPSEWVTRFSTLIAPGGEVLDLASGHGRHTKFLLENGFNVTSLDANISGLKKIADKNRLEIIEADLEKCGSWPLGQRRFAALIVTNYLHRPLFPHIIAALKDNGVLIYETFAIGNQNFGKPSNPKFLLKPGELLTEVFGKLRIIAYEEGLFQTPKISVKQRICAINNRDKNQQYII